MELTVGTACKLTYQKEGDEPKTRVVVPTYIPYPNVRTVSLEDLTAEEAAEMVELVNEYQEYYANALKQLFNFETWVEHSKNKTITPKWRAFKTSNIIQVE